MWSENQAGPLQLVTRLAYFFACLGIAIGFWTLVIRTGTRYVQREIEKQDNAHEFEFKPIEFQEFDLSSWRDSQGYQPNE
jgi:hypothetical protein